MKAYGNGAPEQCAANLLATVRGEVPFDRVRGIDAANVDAPVSRIEDAAADAAWVLSVYEPRVDAEEVLAEVGSGSDAELRARVKNKPQEGTTK